MIVAESPVIIHTSVASSTIAGFSTDCRWNVTDQTGLEGSGEAPGAKPVTSGSLSRNSSRHAELAPRSSSRPIHPRTRLMSSCLAPAPALTSVGEPSNPPSHATCRSCAGSRSSIDSTNRSRSSASRHSASMNACTQSIVTAPASCLNESRQHLALAGHEATSVRMRAAVASSLIHPCHVPRISPDAACTMLGTNRCCTSRYRASRAACAKYNSDPPGSGAAGSPSLEPPPKVARCSSASARAITTPEATAGGTISVGTASVSTVGVMGVSVSSSGAEANVVRPVARASVLLGSGRPSTQGRRSLSAPCVARLARASACSLGNHEISETGAVAKGCGPPGRNPLAGLPAPSATANRSCDSSHKWSEPPDQLA